MTFIKAGLHDVAALHRARRSASLAGGLVSDTILKRTGSANLARKLPIVGGMLLASTIVAGELRARRATTRSSSSSCRSRSSARA